MMHGHDVWIGSLLLQGFTPVLAAPHACVSRIDTDHSDAAAGGHGGEPVPETPSGYAGNGATKTLSPPAAAQCFAAAGAGVGEIEVLDHDRGALVPISDIKHRGDRGTDPPITPRRP
jgi:hypothetical protein